MNFYFSKSLFLHNLAKILHRIYCIEVFESSLYTKKYWPGIYSFMYIMIQHNLEHSNCCIPTLLFHCALVVNFDDAHPFLGLIVNNFLTCILMMCTLIRRPWRMITTTGFFWGYNYGIHFLSKTYKRSLRMSNFLYDSFAKCKFFHLLWKFILGETKVSAV